MVQQNLRHLLCERMRETGITMYRLGVNVREKGMSSSTVYRWMTQDNPPVEAIKFMEILLTELKLKVTVDDGDD